jgi:putative phosphoribosyl transferase
VRQHYHHYYLIASTVLVLSVLYLSAHPEHNSQHEMYFVSNRFLKDRADAGVQLARKLSKYRDMRDEAIVLGLPRGGIVIGYHVARELRLPMDMIVSRKIGCPGHEEYAVGALAQDGSVELDTGALRMLSLSEADLQPTIDKERREAQRRMKVYRGDRPPLDLTNKIAILVDDGIATGSTAKASLRMLQKSNCKKVVLAVPVMPADRVKAFAGMVDELVFVQAPRDFHAVGQFYERFDQTEDEEVLDLMRRNAEDLQRWEAEAKGTAAPSERTQSYSKAASH